MSLTARMVGGIIRQEEGCMLTARRRVEYYCLKRWKGASVLDLKQVFKRLIFMNYDT